MSLHVPPETGHRSQLTWLAEVCEDMLDELAGAVTPGSGVDVARQAVLCGDLRLALLTFGVHAMGMEDALRATLKAIQYEDSLSQDRMFALLEPAKQKLGAWYVESGATWL